jgi:hypothetical protein
MKEARLLFLMAMIPILHSTSSNSASSSKLFHSCSSLIQVILPSLLISILSESITLLPD